MRNKLLAVVVVSSIVALLGISGSAQAQTQGSPAIPEYQYPSEEAAPSVNPKMGKFIDTESDLVELVLSKAVWGDYNNDGNLDMLLIGIDRDLNRFTKLYRNVNNVFTQVDAGLTGVSNGDAAWGDYDKDGDLDLVVTGNDSSSTAISKIYRNDGMFVDINAGLMPLDHSSVAWGDSDNDGDLDLILTGLDSNDNSHTCFYRNDNGTFTLVPIALQGAGIGSVAWGDYNNDGFLDILLTGFVSNNRTKIMKVYENDRGNYFHQAFRAVGVDYGNAAWGDYDNDGYLDIAVIGISMAGEYIATVYRNNAGQSFTEIKSGLPPHGYSSVAWGDYDNDGYADILLTGFNGNDPDSEVYRYNPETGSFETIEASLTGVCYGNAAWGDFNHDGYLDVALTGSTSAMPGSYSTSKIYYNNGDFFGLPPNTPPSAPTNLFALADYDQDVLLMWFSSTDEQTSQKGLSYNIFIGTEPTLGNIVSPMAELQPGEGNGWRRIVDMGSKGKNSFFEIFDLPEGDYYWGVQAVDTAFAGSAFPVSTFSIHKN